MDLDQLIFQHGRAISREAASTAPWRGSTFDLARHYRTRIARMQRQLGVRQAPVWLATPADDAA